MPGRYPAMVAWIRAMHECGAAVCSACSGEMLTAETGLLDGQEATIHWVTAFDPGTQHGDAVVLAAQRWIADNYAVAAPVVEMVRRSRLSSRTFKRRFKTATGETTIAYVQRAMPHAVA